MNFFKKLFSSKEEREFEKKYNDLKIKFDQLLSKWNNIAKIINAKGGQDFLDRGTIHPYVQFSKSELKELLTLCHPDKHDNSEISNKLTRLLLKEYKKK
jgi:CMP-2-keto-3-deoxyoctulosonic acid synthetase